MGNFIFKNIGWFLYAIIVIIAGVLWIASGDSVGAKETPPDYKGKVRQESQK